MSTPVKNRPFHVASLASKRAYICAWESRGPIGLAEARGVETKGMWFETIDKAGKRTVKTRANKLRGAAYRTLIALPNRPDNSGAI